MRVQARVNTRRLVQVTLLIALAGLTRWWLISREPDEGPEMLPTARSDYTLENFELLAMNDQGDPSFQVQSPYLEKVPEDGSVVLRTPVVHLYEEGQHRWRIDANSGWIRADGGEMELQGRVVLAQDEPRHLTIRTQNLRIYPDEDRAHTDHPVRIERPDAQMDGVGLDAWLDSERIELLSEVKGHYEPPNR